VRSEGKEEFEKRVAAARDFFDYWIEREVATVDLNSLGAKMQVATRLAGTVSQVHDQFMRGEIVSKVSARLGVPVSDFEGLVAKQGRGPRSEAGAATTRRRELPAGLAPRHDIALLCLLALRDETARKFFLEQNWREVLRQTPGAELLERILEADLRPEDAASLNAFMATLSPEEEGMVSAWLLQKMPPNATAVAESWWMGLRQAALRRQLDVAESRMRLPQLSTGEVVNLQKQILDLREELHELSQFSAAPRADN
jgi:DNA primase